MKPCISCETVAGRFQPPDGILYETEYWIIFLRSRPLLVAGQGFLVLKRHRESLAELTSEELAEIGPLMQKVQLAYDQVLNPDKVHFALYAEDVKHIHFHVLPRVSSLPAGNIPIVFLSRWYMLLSKLGLRRPFSDKAVEAVALRLKAAI
ncbi:MAG: HIT family protein [Chloroflexota bacterium]